MASLLSTLSLVAFIVAAIALAVAVFLFFFFKIPKVMSDLSGRTARKSIAKIRNSNEKSGDKSYRSSGPNADRVKLTDTIPQTEKGKKQQPEEPTDLLDNDHPETGLLADNKASAFSESTQLLVDEEATGKLVDEDETAPLDENAAQVTKPKGKSLTMIESVVLTHTEESIV